MFWPSIVDSLLIVIVIASFFFFFFQERGYKLANRPEAGIANEKAKALESAYFN